MVKWVVVVRRIHLRLPNLLRRAEEAAALGKSSRRGAADAGGDAGDEDDLLGL